MEVVIDLCLIASVDLFINAFEEWKDLFEQIDIYLYNLYICTTYYIHM